MPTAPNTVFTVQGAESFLNGEYTADGKTKGHIDPDTQRMFPDTARYKKAAGGDGTVVFDFCRGYAQQWVLAGGGSSYRAKGSCSDLPPEDGWGDNVTLVHNQATAENAAAASRGR